MKCSGRQASARANDPGSTSRASATMSPPRAAQSRNPPSNMKLVGSPPDVPARTQNTARTAAAAGPTQCRVRRARALGCPREATRKAKVAPAIRSNRRVSVP